MLAKEPNGKQEGLSQAEVVAPLYMARSVQTAAAWPK